MLDNAMLEQRGSGRGLVHIYTRSNLPLWELEVWQAIANQLLNM